jgi:transposase
MEQEAVLLGLTTTARTAACPCCAAPLSSIHSRYQHRLTDLPWGTYAVRLQLRVRKFVCQNPRCKPQIFTERLPALVAASARKTHRLITVLRAIGAARTRRSSVDGLVGSRKQAASRAPAFPSSTRPIARRAVAIATDIICTHPCGTLPGISQ